jgi:threonine dehydrogenase-like Zn-dependent dehydrogenase
MKRISRAMVLEEFNSPLVYREINIPERRKGETLVRILASGICGSDIDMWEGKDPRTPLPIILGHEGIGKIAEIDDGVTDLFGNPLCVGDTIMWNRGVTCRQCYYCSIKEQPSLCPNRRTYGINMSSAEEPFINGNYSEYLMLMPRTEIFKIEADIDPSILVSAGCAGATSAHANELHAIKPGDTVVVQGPGPVGLFALAFAIASGASRTIVTGRRRDLKLEIAKRFGADEILVTSDTTMDERIQCVKDLTNGLGADHVIDCTGSVQALQEGLKIVGKYGTYSMPGIAVPVGEVPVSIYEDVASKNVRIQGVWVSDTRHTYEAIQLVCSKRFPFEDMVTHRFALEDANKAFDAIKRKEAIKAVLIP